MSMFSMAAADGCLADGRAKSFRPPAEGEVLLFCLSKREVPKRKRHPASAPCGHPVRKVRGRAAGFVDSPSMD